MKSSENYQSIKNSLSHSRISTYEKFSTDTELTLKLYSWNLQISSALFECSAVCEVVIRNAISNAIQVIYGSKWAWDNTFIASLPKNTKETLLKINKTFTTIDKIIPELPFYFWQNLFTARFDNKIWKHCLKNTLPNANHGNLIKLRESVFYDLENIRKLRNRIAHHEPIFNRNLQGDYERIIKIINYCSIDTADWVKSWQRVGELLKSREK